MVGTGLSGWQRPKPRRLEASWRAQRDRLLAVDSLGAIVIALQDSIGTLLAANVGAYRAGYDAAYAGYQDTYQRYVRELKRPRLHLGPTLGCRARRASAW